MTASPRTGCGTASSAATGAAAGLARALKVRELEWVAANGYREVLTWTQRGNEGMRALHRAAGVRLSQLLDHDDGPAGPVSETLGLRD